MKRFILFDFMVFFFKWCFRFDFIFCINTWKNEKINKLTAFKETHFFKRDSQYPAKLVVQLYILVFLFHLFFCISSSFFFFRLFSLPPRFYFKKITVHRLKVPETINSFWAMYVRIMFCFVFVSFHFLLSSIWIVLKEIPVVDSKKPKQNNRYAYISHQCGNNIIEIRHF